MKRSKSSKIWLHEHVNDHYVHRAKAEGYRSRAAFKLAQIDQKDKLIVPGEIIVDLGAAPGGWSQFAAQKLDGRGRVIALDLLEMTPLAGVHCIQGDFREEATLKALEAVLTGKQVSLVLSDMAPNISGIIVADQTRIMHLAELALDFAVNWLKPDGAFLVKVFQGYGYEDFAKSMRQAFMQVVVRKPEASRDRSSEVYLLGRGLKVTP